MGVISDQAIHEMEAVMLKELNEVFVLSDYEYVQYVQVLIQYSSKRRRRGQGRALVVTGRVNDEGDIIE